MPYITKVQREALGPHVEEAAQVATTPGQLNYVLTRIVAEYVRRAGGGYMAISEGVSALECAKLELYRRIAAPYEDQKIQENGDVY